MAFNLPPGCSVRDIPGNGPDAPCDVCGKFPDSAKDPCICPECPECGAFGDPACYPAHGLERSPAQIASLAAAQAARDEEAQRAAESEEQFEKDMRDWGIFDSIED